MLSDSVTSGNRWRRWRLAGRLLGLFGVLNVAAVAIAYMMYPGYVDHGEAAISAMAMRMLAGLPVYLPFDAPDWITNLYGPVTYLWHAWPLVLFGGSLAASKLAAATAAILIPVSLWVLVRRNALAGWLLAIATGMVIVHLAFPVVIRPDALLTVVVAVAVLAARCGAWGATLTIGAAIGIATGIKIHSAVYLVPVVLFHLWGQWRRLPALATAAAALAALPFALPLFPLHDYLSWFAPMAAKENVWGAVTALWWKLAIYLLVPLVVWAAAGLRAFDRRHLAYLAAYFGCAVLILFPATKAGGGDQYYLPLLPIMIDLIRRGLDAGGASARQRQAVIVAALLVIAAAYQPERRFFKRLEWAQSRAIAAEIASILDDHRDLRIQMGVGRVETDIGDQFSYHYYAWRNLPVYRGHPYTLDAGIAMEFTKLGIPFPAEALRRLETCDTQLWIIPKNGTPFALYGYYKQDVFGPEVLDAFARHHSKIESRRFFDLWQCRP